MQSVSFDKHEEGHNVKAHQPYESIFQCCGQVGINITDIVLVAQMNSE